MQRSFLFLLLFALSLSLSSCLEDIDLDTGERILNVYCVLDQGPVQSLDLFYLAPQGGNSYPLEGDVTISLYEGDALVGQFTRMSETRWILDFSPRGGCIYRLEVMVPGEAPLTSETKYPLISDLREVYLYFSDLDESKKYDGNIGFELDSHEDQILWCYFENPGDGPAFSQYIVTDHPGVDARNETIYPFDRNSPLIDAEFRTGRIIDGTPEGFYSTTTGIYSPLFYGTPAFLHERVLRILHPLGFRRSINQDKLRIFYVDDTGPHLEDGMTSSFFGIAGVNRTQMKAQLVICSVSEEYDRYLTDFYFGNPPKNDLSSLMYKRNHFSNIMGGTGIFGASHAYRREYNDLFLEAEHSTVK